MSAECSKHGTDIVYPGDTWPVGVCPSCERDELEAERDRYREALELIEQHARLDVAERGIAECERYAAIAADALSRNEAP